MFFPYFPPFAPFSCSALFLFPSTPSDIFPQFSFFLCSRFCFVSDAARGRENSWLARNDYETFMAQRTANSGAAHTKPPKRVLPSWKRRRRREHSVPGCHPLLHLEHHPALYHSHIVGQSSEAFIGRSPARLADGIKLSDYEHRLEVGNFFALRGCWCIKINICHKK